ncbi:MAG: hypothetical protein ABUL44_04735, partial [Flavobacterium sp.]
DYDRLKHILPFKQTKTEPTVLTKPLDKRFRIIFFGSCIAIVAIIIFGTFYLYEITPGNSEEECRNQCAGSKNPAACEVFCDCIYKEGRPLDSCLAAFNKANDIRTPGVK